MKRVGFLLVLAGSILFAADAARAEGASVIGEFGCFLTSSDSGLGVDLFTNDTLAVETPSGRTLLSCTFEIPAGLEPNVALTNSGFRCGTFIGDTFDSVVVSNPGGTTHFRCVIGRLD